LQEVDEIIADLPADVFQDIHADVFSSLLMSDENVTRLQTKMFVSHTLAILTERGMDIR
jgi:tRNA pseudouridine-54 N-methylase